MDEQVEEVTAMGEQTRRRGYGSVRQQELHLDGVVQYNDVSSGNTISEQEDYQGGSGSEQNGCRLAIRNVASDKHVRS